MFNGDTQGYVDFYCTVWLCLSFRNLAYWVCDNWAYLIPRREERGMKEWERERGRNKNLPFYDSWCWSWKGPLFCNHLNILSAPPLSFSLSLSPLRPFRTWVHRNRAIFVIAIANIISNAARKSLQFPAPFLEKDRLRFGPANFHRWRLRFPSANSEQEPRSFCGIVNFRKAGFSADFLWFSTCLGLPISTKGSNHPWKQKNGQSTNRPRKSVTKNRSQDARRDLQEIPRDVRVQAKIAPAMKKS